jgi:hypothetical protein
MNIVFARCAFYGMSRKLWLLAELPIISVSRHALMGMGNEDAT